jgi:hypothetical protein
MCVLNVEKKPKKAGKAVLCVSAGSRKEEKSNEKILISMAMLFIVFSSHRTQYRPFREIGREKEPFGGISAPYARSWWFASLIKKEDIQ